MRFKMDAVLAARVIDSKNRTSAFMNIDAGRLLRGIYTPSNMERLGRMSDSVEQNFSKAIVFVERFDRPLTYDIKKGMDVLSPKLGYSAVISAVDVAKIAREDDSRLMLYGTSPSANFLKGVQKVALKMPGLDPETVVELVNKHPEVVDSPAKDIQKIYLEMEANKTDDPVYGAEKPSLKPQ
jgi:hypothetical protein